MAQPSRTREALGILKWMLEIDPEAAFEPDEPDLQQLDPIPEFNLLVYSKQSRRWRKSD
jgi:hypothetical protein